MVHHSCAKKTNKKNFYVSELESRTETTTCFSNSESLWFLFFSFYLLCRIVAFLSSRSEYSGFFYTGFFFYTVVFSQSVSE